jgi:hypothetical protein
MRSWSTRTAQAERPPFDPVLTFKILIVQATNNLFGERAEFLINDRLSFMRLLGEGRLRTVFRTPARSGCRGKGHRGGGYQSAV